MLGKSKKIVEIIRTVSTHEKLGSFFSDMRGESVKIYCIGGNLTRYQNMVR